MAWSPTSIREAGARSGFDVIFVSSLFTHLPESTFATWLRRLAGLLTPQGVLLFSVHDLSLLPAAEVAGAPLVFRPASESGRLAVEHYGSTWVSAAYVEGLLAEILPGAGRRLLPRLRQPAGSVGGRPRRRRGLGSLRLSPPRPAVEGGDRRRESPGAARLAARSRFRSPPADLRLAVGARRLELSGAGLTPARTSTQRCSPDAEAWGYRFELDLGTGWSGAERRLRRHLRRRPQAELLGKPLGESCSSAAAPPPCLRNRTPPHCAAS
jgi:hypothetical protein